MTDWDDLRYFLAVARAGSTLAAGRELGVAQSTVQRRLAQLEARVRLPLVQRQASGYRLTEFGEALQPLAERAAEAMGTVERWCAAARDDVSGVIRLTCPEPVVLRITRSGLLERFQARWPRLAVEFAMSDRYLDLMEGEADVALRSGDTDAGALVGRKLADSLWAVYASREHIARHGRPAEVAALASHRLVGLDARMDRHRAAVWLREVAPESAVVARAGSVLGLVQSVKSGIGMAPLPTALGDAEPDLVRVLGPIPELTRIWRLLVRPELRHTPRIAAFFDFMVGEIDALAPILTG